MKNFQTFLLAVALTSSTAIFATNDPVTDKTPVPLTQELGSMLDKHDLKLEVKTTVKVHFTVNKDKEVIVLDIEGGDESVERYIKSRLNYKKLDGNVEKGKDYYLPVTLESIK